MDECKPLMPGGDAGAGGGGGGRPGIVPIPTDREEIFPEPGFVIKTIDDAGRKIFINVCGWGANTIFARPLVPGL